MADKYPPVGQRPALLDLVKALNCRDNALRRDECGDWRINGKQGHIYAVPGMTVHGAPPGEGFQLMFFARCGVNEWDGAGPTQDEAEIIRDIFVIFKKKDMGEPSEAQMAARLALASRARAKASKTRSTDASHPQDRARGGRNSQWC